MTNRTPGLLVCVYYRVAAADAPRVIAGVRELQRTLRLDACVEATEVLIRCPLPANARPSGSTDAAPDDPPARHDAIVDPGVDATVMETYRLALPCAAGPAADATLRSFLATLASAALPLAGLLRGDRHVELFAPCAS